MEDVEHLWHLSLVIQIFAVECKSEYDGSRSPGWRGWVGSRGDVWMRKSVLGSLLSVKKCQWHQTQKKRQQFRFQIVFRDYLLLKILCWSRHCLSLPLSDAEPSGSTFTPCSNGSSLQPSLTPQKCVCGLSLILIPQGDPLRRHLWTLSGHLSSLSGHSAGVLVATGGIKWAGPAGVLGATVTALILTDSHSSKIPWTRVCLTSGIWWRVLSLVMPSSQTLSSPHGPEPSQ